MNTADAAPIFSQSRGAAAAYGSVIRDTDTPRDIEYRVLARATARLAAGTAPDAGPALLAEAVHDNRMVWTAFATDLADPANAWDDQGKARLISLAGWVFAESDRVLKQGRSPADLIEINRTVMQGLRPATPTEAEPVT